MQYRIITVPNLGYASPDVANPDITPVEIWGLDNRDDQRFQHLGYAWPDLSGVTVHRTCERGGPVEDKTILVAYEGALAIGVDVPVADVVPLLIADYGWPEGTTLVDGLPVAPGLVL